MVEVIQATDQNCPLCNLDGIEDFNSDIFFKNLTDDEIVAKLQTTYRCAITPQDLKHHRQHLYVRKRMSRKTPNNIDVVEQNIRALTTQLRDLEKRGYVATQQYNVMTSRLKDWVEMKAKLKGEMVQKVEVSDNFSEYLKNILERVMK